MSKFSDDLAALVTREIVAAKGNRKRMDALLDRLVFSLAQAMTRLTGDDAKKIDKLNDFVSARLYDRMTRILSVDEMLREAKPKPRKSRK